MKPSALTLLVTAVLSACASSDLEQRAAAQRAAAERDQENRRVTISSPAPAADELPPAAPPTEQHAWLQQLAGEWSFRCTATMQAGAEPFEMKGTESVRRLGGLWI
ncbi:MAG TPA: DUF1579 family protein, partial [Planctomycetota bacterium]|nr:DUF1579 family protein [Planctomycetota bacterium]